MTSVSVAMATYNGAKYLGEQLQSLARQTKLPTELVVTDDGSTDGTVAILKMFACAAPFPVLIHENPTRLGYRANFMKAAQLCRSDIIAFCDQDDVWDKNKLKHCVDKLRESNALMLYHNAIVTDNELRQIDTLAKDASRHAVNPPLSIAPLKYGLGFTQLFNRSILEFSRFWERSIDFNDGSSREGHDQWFFFLANVFGAIAYDDTPLVKYRRHTTTATNTTWVGATFLSRTLPFLFEDKQRWHNYATGLERRAEILLDIAATFSPQYASSATAGAQKYRAFARLYKDRLALYDEPLLLKRLTLFSRIILNGGYRSADAWAKGRKSAIKDLIVGVLGVGYILTALLIRQQ